MRSDCYLVAATLLLFVARLPHEASAVPLFQVLNNTPSVSQFASLLAETGLNAQMNTARSCSIHRCFLVFAPNNTAMDNAYKADPVGFNSIDRTALVQQHLKTVVSGESKGLLSAWSSLGTPVGRDIGFGQVLILKTASSTLYWSAKQTGSTWSYRVNNAAIVVAESNKEGDTGVFHVLDQVVLPIGSQQATNDFIRSPSGSIANQLSIQKSLTLFKDWMQRDTGYSYLYNALKGTTATIKVRTLFLPSDAAWARIPNSVMQELNSSVTEFRKVLVAHFAPDICLFTGWMSLGTSISFNAGLDGIVKYNDSRMYLNSAQKAFVSVGGVVAQFVDKSVNYPIGDSVIHVVDRVLAFAYEDLRSLAQYNAPEFYGICSGVPSCLSLLSSNGTQLTLFAPADVSSLSSISNRTQLEQLLMLHFVPGVVGKPSMKESDLLTARNNAGQIRFKMYNSETKYYVEGRLPGRGFVRAELLMFDQPAKNGIFHKVARTLGQPVQTVQDFINSHEGLSSVSPYMGSNGFQPNLGAATMPYTVFPPSNAAMTAFTSYKSSNGASIGLVIMQSASLRDRVFRRIVLPNQKIIADTAAVGVTEYATANTAENEKVTVNLKGSAGLTTRVTELTGAFVLANISLTAGQYECTNGMVYPSDTVLFRDNDVEGYTRSGPARSSSSWMVIATSLTVLLAFRLASSRDLSC